MSKTLLTMRGSWHKTAIPMTIVVAFLLLGASQCTVDLYRDPPPPSVNVGGTWIGYGQYERTRELVLTLKQYHYPTGEVTLAGDLVVDGQIRYRVNGTLESTILNGDVATLQYKTTLALMTLQLYFDPAIPRVTYACEVYRKWYLVSYEDNYPYGEYLGPCYFERQ